MEHTFTNKIKQILRKRYGKAAEDIFEHSQVIQYLNLKTRSADRGSKARSSFANLYAIYVLVEDYVTHNYDKRGNYADYEGAKFTALFRRQRELPFGSKLQNHALNHRLNEEFRKFFPQSRFTPILRDVEKNRYWINENLIRIKIGKVVYNLARTILKIIDDYAATKRIAFERFIRACEQLKRVSTKDQRAAKKFIASLLAPNVDARLFEIVSYAILKYYYHDQTVYFGFDPDDIEEENLKLYKTGRTNANDGGIDFVMRPLGRFFQVTETLEVKKYFLDLDKIERYPMSFVIKSENSISALKQALKKGAQKQYAVAAIVAKYMSCIEEIINLPALRERFTEAMQKDRLSEILEEIIRQSKVEFNYEDSDAIVFK